VIARLMRFPGHLSSKGSLEISPCSFDLHQPNIFRSENSAHRRPVLDDSVEIVASRIVDLEHAVKVVRATHKSISDSPRFASD
jgi:hypothetical protein